MKRYLLDIKADDKPVLLERVLRVIRHRGFIVKQVAGTQNHESKVASVEISGERESKSDWVVNQIEKLGDVRTGDVIAISSKEGDKKNLQQKISE